MKQQSTTINIKKTLYESTIPSPSPGVYWVLHSSADIQPLSACKHNTRSNKTTAPPPQQAHHLYSFYEYFPCYHLQNPPQIAPIALKHSTCLMAFIEMHSNIIKYQREKKAPSWQTPNLRLYMAPLITPSATHASEPSLKLIPVWSIPVWWVLMLLLRLQV